MGRKPRFWVRQMSYVLGVSERKILRIYGPLCEGAIWRSRYNEELYRLYDDLVTTIRITRLRWAGHIVRMQDNLSCKKITLEKPEGRRRVGRPNLRWMEGWMEWWRMQRGWESEIGGSRPRIEMVGGDFLSRPRPCMGCSAWEWVSYLQYASVPQARIIFQAVNWLLFFSGPKKRDPSW